MNNLQIIRVFLAPSFPPLLVPENERQFVNGLKGMRLNEAIAVCVQRGMNPLCKPLRCLGDDVYTFSLDIDGLLIPFAVRVAEAPARVVH